MSAEISQSTRTLQFVTAAVHSDSGPGGIAAVALNVAPTVAGSIHEQVLGTPEELLFRSVLRALQLGKRLQASDITIYCPDETVVDQINRRTPIPPGGSLPLLYMKVRALMHTYKESKVVFAPRSKVAPARKLAVAASRMEPGKRDTARNLFA